MADLLNPFDVFSVSDIAAAINIIPNRWGRVGQLGLFQARPSLTTTVVVEEHNGSLNLLPANTPSGPANAGSMSKRKVRTFAIPKYMYDEMVKPEDVLNLRAFGSNQVASLSALLNDKLTTARAKHDITLEYMRARALTGTVIDGAGTTLFNYFTEFGVSQHSVDFVLGTATTNILGKAMDLKRWIEQHLKGEIMSNVRVLCSDTFFDSFVNHAKVQAAYANWQAAQDRLGGDNRNGFSFGGVIFENYSGSATDPSGSSQNFITAGDGVGFPEGTVNTFATLYGPADFNEAVGSPGQQYYAKVKVEDFDRGYRVHTQTNPLPICFRPEVLVRCFSSN